MMYNGLQNDMTSFAKFAFIFEQEIKVNVKNEEFKRTTGKSVWIS